MRNAFILGLLLVGLASCKETPVSNSGSELILRGQLTTEGVECPALRDEKGVLYTLAGSLGSFKAGDAVCVRGRRAEVSHCMQGITITVESIGPASDCP